MDEEDIENELLVEASELMQLCVLEQLAWHRGLSTDLHLWKKACKDHTTWAGIAHRRQPAHTNDHLSIFSNKILKFKYFQLNRR
jgi:hypothetical protein